MLGLTLQCARCHSHKYDPIPQRDYYQLMSLFTPAYNPESWVQLDKRGLADISKAKKAQIEQHNQGIDREIASLKERLDGLDRTEQVFEQKLADLNLPNEIYKDVRAAVKMPPEERSETQRYLAEKFEAALTVKPEEVALSEEAEGLKAEWEARIADLEKRRGRFGWIQALYDTGPVPKSHLLIRGDINTPGPEVPPGFLSVLCSSNREALRVSSKPKGETSGRRLALAQWLTQPESPAAALVARVMVNRIWHHLFGRGMVATLGNLDKRGAQPTHPRLLEWLSAEFVEGGWRLKPLIKLIMSSAVYQQASRPRPWH